MSRIHVQSYVRVGRDLRPVGELLSFDGDCMYVPGAISLIVDGIEVFGMDLWDDINWLWPYVVQAFDECRRTGLGKRGFPDQPISFIVENAWAGNLLLTVTDGESINRTVVAPADELFEVVARAGLDFFTQLQRLCPANDFGHDEHTILASWQSLRQ